MRQSAISFKAKGLTFEGIVAQPEGITGMPGVVICHPHPLFGGSMDNNVVTAVAFALANAGVATLRFNFRGVGNSEGEHAKGEEEHQEALAALDVIKAWPGVDQSNVGLAGYSFGSGVILNHPELHSKVKALAFISPPLRFVSTTESKKDYKPRFVISGDRDKVVDPEQLGPMLESFTHKPGFSLVKGADHSWVNHEDELGRQIVQFFGEHLK